MCSGVCQKKAGVCVILLLCCFGIQSYQRTSLRQPEMPKVGARGTLQAMLRSADSSNIYERRTFPQVGNDLSARHIPGTVENKTLQDRLPSVKAPFRHAANGSVTLRSAGMYPDGLIDRNGFIEHESPMLNERSEQMRLDLGKSEDQAPVLFLRIKEAASAPVDSTNRSFGVVVNNETSAVTSLDTESARGSSMITTDKGSDISVAPARSLPDMTGVRIGSSSSLRTGAAANLPDVGNNPSIEQPGNANLPVIGPAINTQYEVTERAKLLAFVLLQIGEEGQYKL